MLEAKLGQALLLKQLIDAVKELVTDVNFEVDEEGLKLQAMDNSHVALVALLLQEKGFDGFRCDRNMALGVNVASLQKVIKCAGNEDIVTIRAQEDSDVLNMVFETKNTDRVAEYEMKLMDINTQHLAIPDTAYDAEITLPASEFSRIVRDLKELGESVRIEATKEGVKFSAEGDIGTASVTLKQTSEGRAMSIGKPAKKDDDDDDDAMSTNEVEETAKQEDDDAKPVLIDSDDEQGDDSALKKRKVKSEVNGKAKKAKKETKPKRKKKSEEEDEEEADDERRVSISLRQSVSLTFSIKYLSNFTKASPLSKYVRLHLSNEIPLLAEYDFGIGHVRYYLAPKIADG